MIDLLTQIQQMYYIIISANQINQFYPRSSVRPVQTSIYRALVCFPIYYSPYSIRRDGNHTHTHMGDTSQQGTVHQMCHTERVGSARPQPIGRQGMG